MVATTINRPKKALYKNLNKLKRVKKQMKKKNKTAPKRNVEIPDADIMPLSIFKKRVTCPRANITLSGKKKRKILNQMRRNEKQKLSMDVTPQSNSKEKLKKNQQSTEKELSDVEMQET